METKDQPREVSVLDDRHVAILPHLDVEFSASWRVLTVVDCGQDSGSQKGPGTEDLL